jgi:hypothetical protein
MLIEAGVVAIVRFPRDALPIPAVALIRAVRLDKALVSKATGRRRPSGGWARPRWVPLADIAREATERERVVGMPIDPIPPRAAA